MNSFNINIEKKEYLKLCNKLVMNKNNTKIDYK